MLDTDLLAISVEAAGFTIACLGVVLGLFHRQMAPSYAFLACMFGTLVVADIHEMTTLVTTDLPQGLDDGLRLTAYVSAFLIAPAFLFYVRALTGTRIVSGPRALARHLALAGLAVAVVIALLALPPEMRRALFEGGSPTLLSPAATLVGQLVLLLAIAFYTQCFVYALLVLRVQMRQRQRLKDLFASTERYEVRWVVGMAVMLCSFQVMNLGSLAAQIVGATGPLPRLVDGGFELAIVAVLLLWGYRQSPGLAADLADTTTAQSAKYEKSALDDARAARIAGKLRTAMERDALYRDPNLSLWTLSQHIGVSTNYVSQSLNEHIGRSFFDFVNGWRVEAAKPMIREGTRPIVEIAYEVGFNSRSSFYNAFKKNTGLTPTQFGARAGRDAPTSLAVGPA